MLGRPGDHTILSAQRPRFPGVRDDQQFIAKIDRPNPDSDLSMQRIYHYRVGKGADKSLPKWAGESVDFLFAYGPSISKGMLVAGLFNGWGGGVLEDELGGGVGESAL